MTEQRMITVNMRRAIEKGPSYKRGKFAIKYLREFIGKHMHASTVKIEHDVNELIFQDGIKNPPIKIKVICSKDDKGVVSVKLVKAEAK